MREIVKYIYISKLTKMSQFGAHTGSSANYYINKKNYRTIHIDLYYEIERFIKKYEHNS